MERLARDLVVQATGIVRIRLVDEKLATRLDASLLRSDPGVTGEHFGRVRDSGQSETVEHRSQGVRLHSVLLAVRPPGPDRAILEVAYLADRPEVDLWRGNYRSLSAGRSWP